MDATRYSEGVRKQVYGHTVALRLNINYDEFPKETSWQLVNDDTGAIVDESAGGNQPGLLMKEFYHLTPGNYWFSISDSSWDGICCGSGKGYVSIDQIDEDGYVIENKFYSNGNFGDYLEDDFEVV